MAVSGVMYWQGKPRARAAWGSLRLRLVCDAFDHGVSASQPDTQSQLH